MVRAHWSEPYIGRAHVEGEFDCVDLIVLVRAEVFGAAWAAPPRADGVRGRDAQIGALSASYARPLGADDTPRDGDAVLMRAAGRRLAIGHHIGLWAGIRASGPESGPESGPVSGHVIHCQAGIGTCLHPIAALERRGLEVTGLYRWI